MTDDFGYHAGDLGKSEYRKDFRHGRGTGHFGTGTYSVSSPDKFTSDYLDRPIHKINFSKYKNLYKPKSDDDALSLHDALGQLNNNAKRVFHGWDGDDVYDLIQRTYENDGSFGIYNVNNLNRLAEIYGENPFQGEDTGVDGYAKLSQEDDDRANKMLWKMRGHDWYANNIRPMGYANSAEKYLRNTFGDEAFERMRDYYDGGKDEDDSLSTVFMKMLGYNGIDNRAISSMDNTGYGSVIYDLDDENSSLRDRLRAKNLFGRNLK